MNILSFDTCFDACSVAIKVGSKERVVAGHRPMQRGHAEALMPLIEATMQDADLAFSDLDRIAVTNGPGTFTGTRIGMSAALGFSFAHNLPVVTYSSLQCVARAAIAAMAGANTQFDRIAYLRDARRDRVYLEITDATGKSIDPPALLALGEAAGVLSKQQNCFAFGSGMQLILAAAADLPGVTTMWPIPDPGAEIELPNARFMLADAATRATPEKPQPLYLRPPDAKPSSKPPLARAPAASTSNV